VRRAESQAEKDQSNEKGRDKPVTVHVLFSSAAHTGGQIMSLDIFLSTVTGEEADNFDRGIAERAFKGIAADQDGEHWHLRTCSTTILIHDARPAPQHSKIAAVSANRPPSYEHVPEFWEAMFEILVQTRTIMYWPAGGPLPHCCIANPAMIPGVPADLIDALGEPAFVSSGEDIQAVFDRSFS
jgi:hypothetical protein